MNKIETYVWKEKKIDFNTPQKEIKLIDMSELELNVAYNKCKTMLYNDSKLDPGRYVVLNEINKQINNCSAELAIRWFCQLSNEKGELIYSRFSLLTEIKLLIESYKNNFDKNHIHRLQDYYKGIPTDFNSITIDSIIKGCKDTLGKFNKKPLTKSFIIEQGIWFTQEEIHDFKEIEKLKNMNEILKTIKERFGISYDIDLKLKSTGLSYSEIRAMLNLKPNKKYSELTTLQLETLKNKMLFNLEEKIFVHIKIWENLMQQIEKVASYKGYKL